MLLHNGKPLKQGDTIYTAHSNEAYEFDRFENGWVAFRITLKSRSPDQRRRNRGGCMWQPVKWFRNLKEA